MPRYFFNIHDGEDLTVDQTGLQCESEKDVRNEAITLCRISPRRSYRTSLSIASG